MIKCFMSISLAIHFNILSKLVCCIINYRHSLRLIARNFIMLIALFLLACVPYRVATDLENLEKSGNLKEIP